MPCLFLGASGHLGFLQTSFERLSGYPSQDTFTPIYRYLRGLSFRIQLPLQGTDVGTQERPDSGFEGRQTTMFKTCLTQGQFCQVPVEF